jgi:peptidoglycan/LPS O-acetylase OafA/YrhL
VAVQIAASAVSFETYKARSYFRPLDGLRALSVILVVAFHVRHARFSWLSGQNGVRIFFVISGYIITTLALREETRRGALSLRAFFVRRAARIFPLYYLVLGSYCVLVLALRLDDRRSLFLAALPFYLLYLQEVPVYKNVNRPFAVSWSLGIEEKFYLLWPFLAFRLARTFSRRLAMTTILIVAALVMPSVLSGATYLRNYADILVGCALAFLLHERAWYGRLAVLGRRNVLNASLICLLIQCLLGPGRLARVGLLFPINAAVTVAAIVMLPSDRKTWLGVRPMVWVGQVSYAIYLIHQLGLKVGEAAVPARFGYWGDMLATLIGLVLTFIVAGITRRFIERPLIQLGRRAGDRLRATGERKPSGPGRPT